MILGTAQLGMDYGIHNQTGKPSAEAAFQILEYAYHHGVTMLDTACAYGDAERIIGGYQQTSGHSFQICTKTAAKTAEGAAQDLAKSREQLRCESLWLFYLHNFASCKNEALMRQLNEEKAKGTIQHLGISIYEPQELEYLIKNDVGMIDVVQLPFHLLNSAKWLKQDLLQRAKEVGLLIFARSVFLQGLFFQPPDSKIARMLTAFEALTRLQQAAKASSMSIRQLALSFVLAQPCIDEILLGCETTEQLAENISLIDQVRKREISDEMMCRWTELSVDVPETVIDPRKWTGRRFD